MRLSYVGKLMGDLWGFAKENKAWWIVPLVAVLLLGAVLIVAGQGAAPFIYTLF